jgi:hypothetical protein
MAFAIFWRPPLTTPETYMRTGAPPPPDLIRSRHRHPRHCRCSRRRRRYQRHCAVGRRRCRRPHVAAAATAESSTAAYS